MQDICVIRYDTPSIFGIPKIIFVKIRAHCLLERVELGNLLVLWESISVIPYWKNVIIFGLNRGKFEVDFVFLYDMFIVTKLHFT